MITITKATEKDVTAIQSIAHKTWPNTYGEILSEEQLNYMLDLFYSEAALQKSLTSTVFLIAKENDIALGFTSYEQHYLNENCTRIHKIYILPEAQGKGIGRLLIKAIEAAAIKNSSEKLSLNVNRYNSALAFYKQIGFKIVAEEDITLDFGYLMEDYIMEKVLTLA
jgi:GNAT superfamily N-acetyltransferase